jgi:flagellar assembly factor FliW
MASLIAKYFGAVEYLPEAVFDFPDGIPGFESHAEFLFLEREASHPIVFMQSVCDPGLCFIAVPTSVADPAYELELAPEHLAILGAAEDAPVEAGRDAISLALVTVAEGADPTANLASPIVLNLATRKGVQAVRSDTRYSLRHPLVREAAQC